MKLNDFFIINSVTKAKGRFTGYDIFEYEGAIIVYGMLGTVENWLPRTRGRWLEDARASCPIFVKGAVPEAIERFMREFNGSPLQAVETESRVMAWVRGATIKVEPILNCAWPPRSKTKDAMIERARQTIDDYRLFTSGKPGATYKVREAWVAARLLDDVPAYTPPPGRHQFPGLGDIIQGLGGPAT